jgi:type II secretory pathway component GspD/PulD (secretin)
MFKRLAWLWVAALLVPATLGHTKPLPAGRETPPASMDRHMAPDEYPSNIVKVLRTTNKAQTNSYVPLVFTFRNVNPFSVIRYLRRPVQLEEGDLFTFVTPEGNGGRVLFIVPKYMAETLSELVKRLDVPNQTTSDGTLRIYRQLKHRRASETDADFIASIASFSTGNGSLLLTDPQTNALYWEDAPSGSQALDAALTDWYDVPTAMVQLLVKVYELDAYNDGTIGLDYTAWKNTLGRDLFAVGAYSEAGHVNDVGPYDISGNGVAGLPRKSFSASGYNYAYNYAVSSEFFDFLATKGKAKVLNQAKLATLNTYPASLGAGDQILYYAVKTTPSSGVRDGVAGDGPFTQNDSRVVVGTTNQLDEDGNLVPVETGMSMDIRPIIGEQSIKLDIAIDWSDYNGFDSTGFPLINRRLLNTSIRTGLGDEIVIGGIKRSIRVKATNKMPGLGSLPVVGYAFGKETQQNKNTEVVIAIKPVAVNQYDIAKDYKMTDSEKLTVDQATGKEDIKGPKTTWGFDQFAIDKAKDQPLTDEAGQAVK